MDRADKSYGTKRRLNFHWRRQLNDDGTKKAAQARQNEKEMERTKLKTVQKLKQKEIDRQRDKLRYKKMDKIKAVGKHLLYEQFCDNNYNYDLYNTIRIGNEFIFWIQCVYIFMKRN